MRKKDRLGSFVDSTTASSNINSLILDDKIYDPKVIAEMLLERGIKSKMTKGFWSNKATSEFDMMMNRVLSHIKSIRDEKVRQGTVRTRMANSGYSEKEIDEMTASVRSVVPEPAEYSRNSK